MTSVQNRMDTMPYTSTNQGLEDAKLAQLRALLRETGGIAVAFSSGVDSTFLLKVAHGELGDRVVAVTARSHSFPKREQDEAAAFCAREGIRQVVVDSEELAIPGFRHNPTNRCYLCMTEGTQKPGREILEC